MEKIVFTFVKKSFMPNFVKVFRYVKQGCARLMNQRQHDSSYRPLAMDSSPQLPSGTNYTTSTIVPRM